MFTKDLDVEKVFKGKINELLKILREERLIEKLLTEEEMKYVLLLISALEQGVCKHIWKAEEVCDELSNAENAFKEARDELKKMSETAGIVSIIKKLQENVHSLLKDNLIEQRVHALIEGKSALSKEFISNGCGLIKPSPENDLRILDQLRQLDALPGQDDGVLSSIGADIQSTTNEVINFPDDLKNTIAETVRGNSKVEGFALDTSPQCFADIMKKSLTKKKELSGDEKNKLCRSILADIYQAIVEVSDKEQERLKRKEYLGKGTVNEFFRKIKSYKKGYDARAKTVPCLLDGNDLKEAYFKELRRGSRFNLKEQLRQCKFFNNFGSKYDDNIKKLISVSSEDSEKKYLDKLEKIINDSSDKHKNKAQAQKSLQEYKGTKKAIDWLGKACKDYLPEQINLHRGCLVVPPHAVSISKNLRENVYSSPETEVNNNKPQADNNSVMRPQAINFPDALKNIEKIIKNNSQVKYFVLDERPQCFAGIMKKSLAYEEEQRDDPKSVLFGSFLTKIREAVSEAKGKEAESLKKEVSIDLGILDELFEKIKFFKKDLKDKLFKTVDCPLTGNDLKQAYFKKLRQYNCSGLKEKLSQRRFSSLKYVVNIEKLTNASLEDSEKKYLGKLEKMLSSSSAKHKNKAQAQESLEEYKETKQAIDWLDQASKDYLPEQIKLYRGCLTADPSEMDSYKTDEVSRTKGWSPAYFGNEPDNTKNTVPDRILAYAFCIC